MFALHALFRSILNYANPSLHIVARHKADARRPSLGGLVLLLCLGFCNFALAQAEVSAIPAQFSQGAKIRVVSEGLVSSANYRLRLEQVRPGTADLLLANFTTGAAQTSNSSLISVPAAASGNYDIVLYRVQLTAVRVASTDVVIRSQPSVTLTPTSAAQGKSVRIQVGNLTPGTVRVSFAGATVLGPVPVSGSSWSGKFVVPRDRPTTVPSTTTLVVENLVGRVVAGRTQINFPVLTPNGLPRLGAAITQAPTAIIPRGSAVMLGGTLRTDDGVAPQGRQSAYWRGPNGVVVPLDDQISLSSDGSFSMLTRAPEVFLDGLLMRGQQRGTLLLQNQGPDADTDVPTTRTAQQQQARFVDYESLNDGALPLLRIEVRKFDPANNNPLVENAIVEVGPDSRNALGNGGNNRGAVEPILVGNTERAWSAMRPNQTEELRFGEVPPGRINIPDGFGCEVTYYRKYTNAQGVASFVVDMAEIAQMSFPRFVFDRLGRAHRLGGAFTVNVIGAQLGLVSEEVVIGYDEDAGVWLNSEGEPYPNNRVVVLLYPGNPAEQYSMRNLILDGYGGTERSSQCSGVGEGDGTCEFIPSYIGDLYTYPSTSDFPNANFIDPNALRTFRLSVPTAIFGPLTLARIRIGTGPWNNFNASAGTPTCTLDSLNQDEFGNTATVEYIANVDMKRLPAAKVTTSGRNASGGVNATLELKFGLQPVRTIPLKFSTIRPPSGISATNPAVESFQINANTDSVSGRYRVPSPNLPAGSPGYGVGRLDSQSTNSSVFNFLRTPDNMATQNTATTSTNKIAAIQGGAKGPSGYSAFFGFTNNNNPQNPDPVTLFDTGLIPLFRYVWGIPPIAQATLGADFWSAATLAFYGELKTQGMNATIDPDVAGGVNIFFDLEALLGLVSATITAESEIGITMRSVINGGGLAHLGVSQQSGECFRFDLTAVWEACAAGLCGGGREPLICSRSPNNCIACQSNAPAAPNALGLGLNNSAPSSFNALDLPSPKLTSARLASDGRGNAVTIAIDRNGDLIATHLRGTETRFVQRIAVQPVAPQHLAVAYYKTDGAMAVWAANRASAASIRTLMQQQGGRAFDDIVRTQVLYYSSWDGRAWSAPAQLTTVGSDGKVQLAGCLAPPRFGNGACAGGEISAVWERDANNNLDAPDLEVWHARWRAASGWSSQSRVSSAGVSTDMHPQVAYLGSTPIVAWAHNPAGHFTQLQNRQLAYRFLDGSSTQKIATSLGTGIGWISLGVSNANRLVIAYTRTQDPNSFVGNRHALFAARSILCLVGSCTFEVTEPRDEHGRQFRIERPRVSFDAADVPVIGFRALAYGANSNGQVALAGDPIGIITGTGEVGLVRVHDFQAAEYRARLLPLTNDGLQHWSPDIVFDESLGGVLAVSGRATAPQRTSRELVAAKAISGEVPVMAASRGMDDGSVLIMMGGAPDFALEATSASRAMIGSGQSIVVRTRVVNQGASYDSIEHGTVRVVAAWDAPAGAGISAGTFTVSSVMATNATQAITFNIVVPNNTNADERRSLFVSVVADDEANEVTGPKDQIRLDFNAMPVPQSVNAQANGDPLVSITWDPSTDTRIAGWRIWKLDSTGVWRHLGSTRSPGYLDFRGAVGARNSYRVASYSNNGIESQPSADASIVIEPRIDEEIFRNSFESPQP
jgi:hypothetical protein